MKRKIKWHKFKCKAKNFVLVAITVLAVIVAMISFMVIAEEFLKALFSLAISLFWICSFGYANSWGEYPW